ncbi:hypothetical protein Lnau_2705 [Legionella nautarum]|uniref:Uncharacterized protein n=1 Tax=Legionella nautarum TaxID=45070 RepID=A0A0W0WL84_9GAMM|nr:hypothetical protein [Legionella nautarum]KTD33057.1 hypothetical protein Lnau_2705 [Legionella nautarum]
MPKDKRKVGFFGEKSARPSQKKPVAPKISKKSKNSGQLKKVEPQAFNDYLHDAIREATRIRKISSRQQRYSGAQFEVALIGFADIKTLKTVMDKDIYVNFDEANIERDWTVGFDWLDLAVSYHDPDAIEYFQTRLEEVIFRTAYENYKREFRPDCSLINYEQNTTMSFSVK